MIGEVRVRAPAKVNLILRVLDRRSDGYHNVWSLMQTVGLEDDIHIRLCPESSGINLQCDSAQLMANEQNLVWRAAKLTLERAEVKTGVHITLTKRIPLGAGLGGGSSDAAATIFGLNHLLGFGWSAEQMAEMGQVLGSDVPFFFYAPSALVTGRGEQVDPVQLTGGRWVVLVNPGFPVETRWAYQQLASVRSDVRPLSDALRRIEQQRTIPWENVLSLAENDFEEAVFPTHGVLRKIKAQLLSAGAEGALLSGSGATVFGVFRDEARARRAEVQCAQASGLKVFTVPTAAGHSIATTSLLPPSTLG